MSKQNMTSMTCFSCDNAYNPLLAALSTSVALALLVTSSVSCSFLEIRSRPNDVLVILDTSLQEMRTASSVGMICEGDGFYDLSDERMRTYSLIFFIGACIAGSCSCILAWTEAFGYSKPYFWQCISAFAAIASLLQLPIFLLFEMEVCTDYTEDQECYLDLGRYHQTKTTFLSVVNAADFHLLFIIIRRLSIDC